MEISNWYKDRPSNDSLTNDCIYFLKHDKTLADHTCNFPDCCCPVCIIARVSIVLVKVLSNLAIYLKDFQLRGVCENSLVDVIYYYR